MSSAAVPEGVPAFTGDPANRAEWDALYSEREQVWSGDPNGALVTEVASLSPGRVLDVGCGEGADAVWLARRGWTVTGLEVSGVALQRAIVHAQDAGVSIRWVHAGLAEAALEPGGFDLVSAQYPALPRTPSGSCERALLDAVAPGGVLLLVHHAGFDAGFPRPEPGRDGHGHGHEQADQQPRFDPADFVWPSMINAMLDDDWAVEAYEERARIAPSGGAGAHHADDIVLRARRLR